MLPVFYFCIINVINIMLTISNINSIYKIIIIDQLQELC